MGQKKTVMITTHGLERVILVPLNKTGANGWGSAKQIHQEPHAREKVSDQREIALGLKRLRVHAGIAQFVGGRPECLGQGKVVVNARNGLHFSPVTHAQSVAINPLHLSDIGGTEFSDGDPGIAMNNTGHASVPHNFFIEMPRSEAMQIGQGLLCLSD